MKSQLAAALVLGLINLVGTTVLANAAGASESDSVPIELTYGYRFKESSITTHLEQYLWTHHNIAAEITYSDRMRDPSNPLLTDQNLFRIDFASGQCSVHALSLPSSSPATIESYGGRSHFLPIPHSSVANYAPNYYRTVLSNVDNISDPSDSSEPYFSLPGYDYLYEKSVFVIAANTSALSMLGLGIDDGAPLPQDLSLPNVRMYHLPPVEFSDLDSALSRLADPHAPPFLAWKNFEHSFAPLYSAFGLSTVGNNLTNVDSRDIPYFQEPDGTLVPAQISSPLYRFLKKAAHWYANDIVNRDFVDTDYRDLRNRVTTSLDNRSPLFFSIPYSLAFTNPRRYIGHPESHQDIGLLQIVLDGRTQQSLFRSPFAFAEAYNSCVSREAVRPLLLLFEYTRWPESTGWIERIFGLENVHYYRLPDDTIEPFFVGSVSPALPGSRDPGDYAMWHFKVLPEVTLDWSHTRTLYLPFASFERTREDLIGFDRLLYRNSLPRTLVLAEIPEEMRGVGSALSELTLRFVSHSVRSDDLDETAWTAYVKSWKDGGGAYIVRVLSDRR